MRNIDEINKRTNDFYRPTGKEMVERLPLTSEAKKMMQGVFYKPTIQEKINDLVKEHKIEEAQKLYFEDQMSKRKDLVRL